MNREFKFRVWDKGLKQMLYPTIFTIDAANNFVSFPYMKNEIAFQLKDIQGFTGMVDKDKKPIYDGDIVRVHRLRRPELKDKIDYNKLPWPEDHWYDCVEIAWIHWSDLGFSYVEDYDYRRYDDIYPLSSGTEHRYEVIGNIFQNPELLDGYAYNPARNKT